LETASFFAFRGGTSVEMSPSGDMPRSFHLRVTCPGHFCSRREATRIKGGGTGRDGTKPLPENHASLPPFQTATELSRYTKVPLLWARCGTARSRQQSRAGQPRGGAESRRLLLSRLDTALARQSRARRSAGRLLPVSDVPFFAAGAGLKHGPRKSPGRGPGALRADGTAARSAERFGGVGVSISELIPASEGNGLVLPQHTEIALFGRSGYSDVVL